MYPPELRSTNLDFEWVYRKLAPAIMVRFSCAVYNGWKGIEQVAVDGVKRVIQNSYDVEKKINPKATLLNCGPLRRWYSGWRFCWLGI